MRTTSAPSLGTRVPGDDRHAQQVEYARAAEGLATELEAEGFAVERLRELRRRGVGDRRALPILLRWWELATFAPLKCDLAYVLASRWAQPEGVAALLDEYQRLRADECPCVAPVRAAICTSLERVADDTVVDDISDIALDTTLGSERGMAVIALGNMRSNRHQALDLLVTLLDDDDVVLFAVLGLLKLDGREALRRVAFLASHRHPIVRQVAMRTVRRWVDSAPQTKSS